MAKLVGQLVRQGRADQQAEIDAHRRRRRGFALTVEREEEPSRVDEADVALYHIVAAQMVDKLSAEQYSLMRGAIEAGLRAGETELEMGARIDQLETGLARRHCDTWARTESTRYYTLGRVETVEAADDVWGYEFVVIVDNRTTEICRAFVGKRVSKAKLKRFPPFHYNCRTTVMAVFFDEAPEVDDELGPEARPDEGFGEDPRELFDELVSPDWRRRRQERNQYRTDEPYHEPVYERPEPLHPETERRIRRQEREDAEASVEYAAAFDRAGNLRGRRRGKAQSARLPEVDGSYEGLIVSHNHPGGGGFSARDIWTAIRHDLFEIRAVDAGMGHLYRLQRPAEGWPSLGLQEVEVALKAADDQVSTWAAEPQATGAQVELVRDYHHVVLELLAERLRFKYTRYDAT